MHDAAHQHPARARHLERPVDRKDVRPILARQPLALLEVQLVLHLIRNGLHVARRDDVAEASRARVRDTIAVAAAESLLKAQLQRIVVGPPGVDQLEDLRAEVRVRPHDRRRAARARAQPGVQILPHVQLAHVHVDVIGAERHVAGELPLVSDRRLP